jgi:hypothetical protein
MKRPLMIAFPLIFYLIPSICIADSYSWTDNTGIAGNQYTLTVTGNTITLDITTSSVMPAGGPWYIDWIQFKITDKALSSIGSLSTAEWAATTSANQVQLQKFGAGMPNDGFGLIYWTGIQNSSTNPNSGVLLDGSKYEFVLNNVDFGGQTLFPWGDATLKVGYYDSINGGGQFDTRQMSQKVPEPGTLLFLGAGLIGLWGFRKKIKK